MGHPKDNAKRTLALGLSCAVGFPVHTDSRRPWCRAVPFSSFADLAPGRDRSLPTWMGNAASLDISPGDPFSYGSDSIDRPEPDHLSASDPCFEAVRLDPSPPGSASPPGRQRNQPACNAPGSSGRLQRNSFPPFPNLSGGYVRVSSREADGNSNHSGARFDSYCRSRQRTADRGNWVAGAVLGPGQGGRVFPCFLRMADLCRVTFDVVCPASPNHHALP